MSAEKRCIIVGASHGGVNCAFALRKEGYEGEILLIDQDPNIPYHRPPLSKTFLTDSDPIEKYQLKSRESYEKERIELKLGSAVVGIDIQMKAITLADGSALTFDDLVLAVGASALYPPIEGLKATQNLFVLRAAQDVLAIKEYFETLDQKRIVIIGGGYIGLEIAASFRKLDADVTLLEREERVLSRVTSPEMSDFFQTLHQENGVKLALGKNVSSIQNLGEMSRVTCSDGSPYDADLIILGVGIKVNTALAEKANLEIEKGIVVNGYCQTSRPGIWAIGDCTQHFNPRFQQNIRLESVQNAVEQAKVAAANICGKETAYDSIPWFWSDQYDVKLQMVGLPQDYDNAVMRIEEDRQKRSMWYFRGDELLAVDAVNNPKAYILGTKFIKNNTLINKAKLADCSVGLKAEKLLVSSTYPKNYPKG